MDNKDLADRTAKSQAFTGERWRSDAGTVERRDRERPDSGADLDTEIINRTGAGIPTLRRYDQPAATDDPN